MAVEVSEYTITLTEYEGGWRVRDSVVRALGVGPSLPAALNAWLDDLGRFSQVGEGDPPAHFARVTWARHIQSSIAVAREAND